MKPLITCLILYIVALSAHAQPIDISPQLTANHSYDITFKGYINYNVVILGKSPLLASNLESAGMILPINAVETANIKAQVITGSPEGTGQIPFNYTIVKADYNMQTNNPKFSKEDGDDISALMGKMAKGTISAKGKLKVDSITNERLVVSDVNRQDMINIFDLAQFAGKKLEVGKSYTTRSVVNLMEMFGKMITFNRKSEFKLIEIKENKAYFDVLQNVSGSFMNDMNLKSLVTGAGTGKMIFDLTTKMPVEYYSDLKVKVSMPFTATDLLEINYQSLSYNIVKIQ